MSKKPGTRDTVVDTLIELFKENLGTSLFKQYFFGDPVAVPQSMLPAIAIDLNRTSYELGPSYHDEVTHEVTIQLLFNKKDDFGKPEGEVGVMRDLQNAVQARDETTGEFLPTSILGILRKNLTMGNLMIESVPSVEFGIVPRPSEVVTAEAHITVTITELQEVSGRS